MARVNVDSIRPTSCAEELRTVPWETSDVFNDSAVIKNSPGAFGGIIVNFLGGALGPFSVMDRIKAKLRQVRAMIVGNWPFPVPPPAPVWWLVVWDSPDADTTGDVVLACYPFPIGAYLGRAYSMTLPSVGVKAHLGIYVEVSMEGDTEYTVYYR
jgi:hypothetical protein